jgi:hypothetical protein
MTRKPANLYRYHPDGVTTVRGKLQDGSSSTGRPARPTQGLLGQCSLSSLRPKPP